MPYNCVINSEDNNLSKDELMNMIQSYAFAVNDLTLYLDTHIDSDKALKLHNEYTRELKKYVDIYEKNYGPLTMYCPCNSWRWIANPWGSFDLGLI